MRKRDSCETVSTSGELFMMVLTRVMGRLMSLAGRGALEEGFGEDMLGKS